MNLPLRITFEGQDYTYTILNKIIDKETTTILVRLNDQELTLIKNKHGVWDALEQSIGNNPGLINAIARNIALRFRL